MDPEESIVVASTDYDHLETEQMTIDAIGYDKRTIYLKDKFRYKHYAGRQYILGTCFDIRTEVDNLNRSIVIQGDKFPW